MDSTPLLYIVSSFLTGGIAQLVLNKFWMSKKEEGNYLLLLVKQLQANVNANNEEIIVLKAEIHQWRDKYYAELEEKNKLTMELRQLRLHLQKYNDKPAS
jgi:hypothetical protein